MEPLMADFTDAPIPQDSIHKGISNTSMHSKQQSNYSMGHRS